MAGYVRQDTANNIANGNVVDADDLDGEFNSVEAAFNSSTGHTHDGTSAEGAPILVTGPAQEYVSDATALYPKTDDAYDLGKVGAEFKDLYLDGTANIDSLIAETATIRGGTMNGTIIGAVTPTTGNFNNIFGTNITASVGFSGPATLTDLSVSGTFTVDSVEVFNATSGHTHDGTADNGAPITVIGPAQDIIVSSTTVLPKTTATYDLGSNLARFKDFWISGTATLVNAQIGGGSINNTTIGNTSAATIRGTTITATTGFVGDLTGDGILTDLSVSGTFSVGGTTVTSTAAELNILDGATLSTTELNRLVGVTSDIQTQFSNKQPLDATLTGLSGLATGVNKIPRSIGTDTFSQLDFLDEDDFSSNSASGVPSQQSVKAYVNQFGWALVETIAPAAVVDGKVSTSDFASGYEYMLQLNDFVFTSDGNNRSAKIEVYKADSAAWHTSILDMTNNSSSTSPVLRGVIILADATRDIMLHHICCFTSLHNSPLTGESADSSSTDLRLTFRMGASSEPIGKVRIGNGSYTGATSGEVSVYRRRII